MDRQYFVYILASRRRTLYIGLTNDLARRLSQHRDGEIRGFTNKYRTYRLVHSEQFGFVVEALRREKQLKGWTRAKKVALIEAGNPTWRDLAREAGGLGNGCG